MTRTVYLYACDTMADWEYGYAVAGINQPTWQRDPGSLQVRTVGATADPVTTMGGIRITPDGTVADLAADDSTAMLVLPGAATWDQPSHAPVVELAKDLLDKGIPVAAICGATVALAAAGLFNDRDHTSNDPRPLAMGGGYTGADRYQDVPACTDGDLITAGAASPLEFAREIFARLRVYDEPVLDAWYGLYSTGDPRYYEALTSA